MVASWQWHLWYWLLTVVYLLVPLPFVILTRNHSTVWFPWHLWYWLVTFVYLLVFLPFCDTDKEPVYFLVSMTFVILTGLSTIRDTDKEPVYFMVSMTFVILTGLSTICDSDKEPVYFMVSMTFVILTRNQYTLWFPWHLWYWQGTSILYGFHDICDTDC